MPKDYYKTLGVDKSASKEEIKKLNKKFRGKNKTTDVLSFELAMPDKKEES